MKSFDFKKIDAFATKQSAGNPAGYIGLSSGSDLNEDEMLQVARELKGFVNEVGYVHQIKDSEFNLKYYSSEREVDFCGHATIAILYDLIAKTEALQRFEQLLINTNRGKLPVYNHLSEEDAVFIQSPKPIRQHGRPDMADLIIQLKVSEHDLDASLPVSVINAGLTTLLVPIKSLKAMLAISPELNSLKRFCHRSNIDIIEVFTGEVADARNDYRSRVFAPTFGYLEDPATGSGNSALGYYLIDNNLWFGDTLSIEQNGLKDAFNIIKLRKRTDENGDVRVLFGGRSITRIEGKYYLH